MIADNDPDAQEKIIKFNQLLANRLIFHTALDMTVAVRDLIAEGYPVGSEDLATSTPYQTRHLRRFGDLVVDTTVSGAFNGHIELGD